ncbi:Penicillin-insensitive murein endopeptidase precursor [Enhygromyxa salina]|uniref:Penicillin-insensitive murein endopeptidase n=1 Tax=Enhygromyxa salina TaxID=215803 RepID=A0A2S9XG47_9BACT|nr:penicillin-insensitive murein endopeptidase [Enhygromyxa salina]PRP91833.1 Penicillin-insensitive murein endopeptidase precursor [Enhygromyxa salina]
MTKSKGDNHRQRLCAGPSWWVRSRGLLVTAALSSVWLPALVAASPPEVDSRFGDLPSPDELPTLDELAPAPAVIESEAEAEAEAEPESSPPAQDQAPAPPQTSEEPEDAEQADAPEPKFEIKTLKKAKWIKHRIIPGERLDDIAARYSVRRSSLIRWNKLDKKKPRIYAGRELAVYTKHIPPPQQKLIYTVKYGDTWNKIAKAHHVDPDHLRLRWNSKVPRKFKAGQELVIWLDPLDDPDLLRDPVDTRSQASAGTSAKGGARSGSGPGSKRAVARLPLAKIKTGSVSVGRPNRGKIVNAIPLPENRPLYTLRKPDQAYGSSHALHNLQLAIANFRQASGFSGEIVIGSISKKGGGRLKPHSSHQSGRDVDIRLPVKNKSGSSDDVRDVDWDATWSLIQALVSTGEVQYIFLTTSRQKHLYKAAKRAGASKDMIERVIQYPNKSGSNSGIVRHAKGHTAHFHVRFTCAANETRCESY